MRRCSIITAGIALFTFAACNRLSSNEEKIIGTWEARGGFGPRCVFNRDHTSAVLQLGADGKWTTMSEGRWRLEGNDIVDDFKFTFRAPDPGETPHAFTGRMKVLEFQRDKLVMETLEQSLFRVK
jgi:hypothetical protein